MCSRRPRRTRDGDRQPSCRRRLRLEQRHKATPVLSGDLLGDWREEVVWRTEDSSALRIYVSTIPTPHRLVTLLHDRQYRLALVWQNVGYNQPPHPSFDMETKLHGTE